MMHWENVPVYLHRQPVDFRKSINGLSLLVAQGMGMSSFQQALFVFGSRSRNRIKVLYWDQTGYCLWYKRLEKDKFHWPKSARGEVLTLSAEQFDWLLRGFDILKMRPHAAQKYEDVI